MRIPKKEVYLKNEKKKSLILVNVCSTCSENLLECNEENPEKCTICGNDLNNNAAQGVGEENIYEEIPEPSTQ